jgi:hypothetical protein
MPLIVILIFCWDVVHAFLQVAVRTIFGGRR